MEHMLRGGRIIVYFALAAGILLASFVRAADPAPLGTLRTEGTVYVGKEAARTPMVVYSGDYLRTDEGRATLSSPRGAVLVLDRQSGAGFKGSQDSLVVSLEKGNIALSALGRVPLEIEADGLAVQAAGTYPSLAEVALRSNGAVEVAVYRGKVSVGNLRKEPVVVAAGQLLKVGQRLAAAQEPAAGAPPEEGRPWQIGGLTHGQSIALVAAIVAGAAAAVAIPLALREEESPASP